RGEGTAKVDPQNSKAHSLRPQIGVDSPSPGGEGWGEGERSPTFLFCDNETNSRRLYGQSDAQGFFKDGFDEYVVHGNQSAVNPNRTGTKAGALYRLTIAAGGSTSVRLRLSQERGLQSASPSKSANIIGQPSASNAPTRGSGLKPAPPFADFNAT